MLSIREMKASLQKIEVHFSKDFAEKKEKNSDITGELLPDSLVRSAERRSGRFYQHYADTAICHL